MDDGRLDALGQTIVSALPEPRPIMRSRSTSFTVAVQADKIVDVVRFLRDDPGCRFVSFIDVTAVDYPGREKRFDVVLSFVVSDAERAHPLARGSPMRRPRCRRSSRCFPVADWFERECYDLYGVIFTGHPDMRRLLTDYGFEGHPLHFLS